MRDDGWVERRRRVDLLERHLRRGPSGGADVAGDDSLVFAAEWEERLDIDFDEILLLLGVCDRNRLETVMERLVFGADAEKLRSMRDPWRYLLHCVVEEDGVVSDPDLTRALDRAS
jgi:hypothetical protein